MEDQSEEEKALTREQLESMTDRQLIVHIALEHHATKKDVLAVKGDMGKIHKRLRSLENLRFYGSGFVAACAAFLYKKFGGPHAP